LPPCIGKKKKGRCAPFSVFHGEKGGKEERCGDAEKNPVFWVIGGEKEGKGTPFVSRRTEEGIGKMRERRTGKEGGGGGKKSCFRSYQKKIRGGEGGGGRQCGGIL